MTNISQAQAGFKANSRRNPLWISRLFNAKSSCGGRRSSRPAARPAQLRCRLCGRRCTLHDLRLRTACTPRRHLRVPGGGSRRAVLRGAGCGQRAGRSDPEPCQKDPARRGKVTSQSLLHTDKFSINAKGAAAHRGGPFCICTGTIFTKNRTIYRPKRPILPELHFVLCFALRPIPGCGILMLVILKPGYGVPGHQRGNER